MSDRPVASMEPKGLFNQGGLGACSQKISVAKLNQFLCVFGNFQPICLMYRLDLNYNASFTLPKT